MYKLLVFFRKYQLFGLFLLLEIISFWMVVNYNDFQNAVFFNTSNAVAARLLNVSSSVSNFVNLTEANDQLALENASLKDQLTALKDVNGLAIQAKQFNEDLNGFEYIPGKVINNSLFKDNNYLTLNVGKLDSITIGMGVVGKDGVVGKVISVSDHYATVQGLLHSNYMVSSQIKSTKVIGTTVWKGEDITTGHLLYIPRHIPLKKGELVITSGYNAIFPEGISIGNITEFNVPNNESFYDVEMKLTTDFSTLYYVYVVKNKHKKEQESIEIKEGN